MKTRVGINGFGRIGRNAFRVAFDRDDLEIVGINDLTDTKTLAHLLKHDTSYGTYPHTVSHDETGIIVNGVHIPVFAEKDPAALPWGDKQADVIIESTGRFTTGEAARAHIKAGAKRVVISAPSKGDDVKTVVIGVNEDELGGSGEIISNASCTTNSVAAVMDIMDREFGVDKAMLTTVHSYTASQVLQDGPSKDLREGRAAAENIVPTTTGAAVAVAQTVPSLQGRFDGMSVRVPTPVVSLSDVTMVLKRETSKDEINEVFKRIEKEPYYQGIIGTTDEPLVSKDFVGDPRSGIVDLSLTNVVAGNLAKVVVWYDNEWGYSNRLVELVADVGRTLQSSTPAPAQDQENNGNYVHADENDNHEPQSHEQHAEHQDDSMPSLGSETNSVPVKIEVFKPEEHHDDQHHEEVHQEPQDHDGHDHQDGHEHHEENHDEQHGEHHEEHHDQEHSEPHDYQQDEHQHDDHHHEG